MKKLILGLALAAGLFTTASAQDQAPEGRTPQERADRLTAMMTKRLELTPDQSEKVRTINLKYADQAKAVHEERKQDKGAQPGALKDMKASKDAELKQVLNPEQYTKWMEMEKQMVEKHKERREARRSNEQTAPTK